MTIRVKTTSVAGGFDLDLTCSLSGRPLTEATEDGMFCDAERCVCKEESVGSAEILKDLLCECDKLWRTCS